MEGWLLARQDPQTPVGESQRPGTAAALSSLAEVSCLSGPLAELVWDPSTCALPRQDSWGKAESRPEGQTGALQDRTVQGACQKHPLPPGSASAP